MKVARIADLNDPFELLAYRSDTPKSHELARRMKREVHNTLGFLCFSRDWTSPLLWSQYGDKQRGVALGFDVDTAHFEPLDVEYSAERLAGSPDVEQMLSTKAVEWRYEQEIRVLVELKETQQEGTLHFYPFDDALHLREVILGPECEQSLKDTQRMVTAVCPHRPVVIRACRASKFFKVVPDDRTVPRLAPPS